MKLRINRGYRNEEGLPLFHKYPQQFKPQPAYLEVEVDGEVRVSWSGEIGNAVPMSVWNGVTLRFRIPERLTVQGIDDLLGEVEPLIEEMIDHFEIVWDGSNHVGRLDERGRWLHDEIEAKVGTEYDTGYVIDEEWFAVSWNEVVAEYRDAKDKDAWLKELKEDLWDEHKAVLENEDRLIRSIEEAIE